MDYKSVYQTAFSDVYYSNNHHIQYDYVVQKLKTMFNPDDTFELIDVGSGRGQLLQLVRNEFKNSILTSVDLQKIHNVQVNYFIECDLSSKSDRLSLLTKKYDVLVCTDVLEHLDKSFIVDVFDTFLKLSNKSILAIANHSDILNGLELHTIQEDNQWWESHIKTFYSIDDMVSAYNGRLYMYFVTSLQI
jgi:cyclopropane fatty-acyl-phospholipid synthase-like methyltransferase